ncbi:MAG: PAS domain S-box protein, partial [Gallionellaceae bacterium]|nr:PAS domain S-box protein [Gallionellaceae bacterium]
MNLPPLLDFSFGLLLNAALLLSLLLVIDLVLARGRIGWLSRPSLAAGLMVGLVGILLIKVSATLMPGIIFDTRSVLLALSGLLLGPAPTAIAMAMTAAYRGSLGGQAAGVGVLVILASGLIGLAFRWAWRRPVEEMGWRPLYGLGLAVHVVMLAFMLLLPWPTARTVLASISLPVLLIHPLITLALGLLLVDRLRRRRDLDALHEQEARYHSLFEDNQSVMLIIDPADGAIVDANAAATAYYGWPRERLKSMRIGDLATLPAAELRAELAAALARRRQRFEASQRHADGSLREVELFGGPLRLGGRDYLYAIVHDIGDRKAAETALQGSETLRRQEHEAAMREQEEARRAALNLMEDAVATRHQAEAALDALRESERRFQDIAAASADWIWEVDREGRYTYVSGGVEDMIGYRPEEMLGRRAFDFMPADEAVAIAARFADIVARGEPFRDLDNVDLHKDGSRRQVQSSG